MIFMMIFMVKLGQFPGKRSESPGSASAMAEIVADPEDSAFRSLDRGSGYEVRNVTGVVTKHFP